MVDFDHGQGDRLLIKLDLVIKLLQWQPKRMHPSHLEYFLYQQRQLFDPAISHQKSAILSDPNL
jgi:hypothetical protein